MLWPKMIHKVGDGQLPEQNSKSVVHSFGKDGSLQKLPDTLYVLDLDSGRHVLQITHAEFNEKPDREFWIKKALKNNPALSSDRLTIDYTAKPR